MNDMHHANNLQAALTAGGQPTIGALIVKGVAAGIPYGEIISQLVLLAAPAFIAWIEKMLGINPKPAA